MEFVVSHKRTKFSWNTPFVIILCEFLSLSVKYIYFSFSTFAQGIIVSQ